MRGGNLFCLLGSEPHMRTDYGGNRMPRIFSCATLALMGIALLAGCAGLVGSDRRETNAEVMLISFGGSNGELAPCG